ncbi:hypothetical protein GCM10007049_22370 [Echinicola pacifica]|uniref:Mechanosensitive ion channel MscS domain-containing protein n=1 Tax=Echinicola pacifica TaxID=346377 RepID=A0A918Q0S9_9BACT|nr:mechanosensitive ion channel domain-containing protein [Echinicola pacifica]GGZ28845.1 hypothetical protein GCM10007049_22370 [Echinicola pacifica]
MTNDKTALKDREKRKRVLFVIKLISFLILLWFSNTISTFLTPYFRHTDNVLKALTFLLSSHMLISLGRLITVRFYLSKKATDPFRSNFVLGINHISSILNVAVFLISLMFLFGVNPLNFFASITIVAAAIALLSKDYITNMINGLIIMFSDQLSLGDKVRIADQTGRIQDVTLLNLVILNEEGDTVMIPNNLILSSQIVNHSRQNSKKLTFDFELNLGPETNLDQIKSRLYLAVNAFDQHLMKNTFTLKTVEIMANSLKLKCQFMLINSNKALIEKINWAVHQEIISISRENRQA